MIQQQTFFDEVYGFNPTYLKPPPEAYKIRHDDYYSFHGTGVKGRRKTYQQVEYTKFENDHIELFIKEIEKAKIELPSTWRKSDYLKMLYSGHFDMKKTLKQTREHIQWLNNPAMHTFDEESLNLLKDGFVYLMGRDNQFRPVIYLDCTKLNIKKQGQQNIVRALCVFLDMIRKYMFIDHCIENWIMIIETGNLGVSHLPLQALGVIIGQMQINYCATLEKMFLTNPSWGLSTAWSIIDKFIDPETSAKIQLAKPSQFSKIQQLIPLRYIEKKYGGEHENLTVFWPPINVFTSDQPIQQQQIILQDQIPLQNPIIIEQNQSNQERIITEEKEKDKNSTSQQDEQQHLISSNQDAKVLTIYPELTNTEQQQQNNTDNLKNNELTNNINDRQNQQIDDTDAQGEEQQIKIKQDHRVQSQQQDIEINQLNTDQYLNEIEQQNNKETNKGIIEGNEKTANQSTCCNQCAIF